MEGLVSEGFVGLFVVFQEGGKKSGFRGTMH